MRSRTWKLVRLVAPVGLIPLFACLAPPVESPKTTVTQETSVRVLQSVKNKVDILFMVDNSLSMAPKQAALRARFPQLIKRLQDFAAQGNPASYHIGVVDSDLGAGLNTANCKAGGDGGKLQVVPTNPSTVPPPANCSSFGLSGGISYLDYNQLTGTDNIMGGLSLEDAFNCMTSVGDEGCGFEHQLESAYRSLHDKIAENTGFLRSDAILAVVFVTDEDDCSAPDDTDLFVSNTQANSMYGVLHSFRCTQFGVQCNGMPLPAMSTPTPFMGCTSYDLSNGGKLTDINTYINFFTKPAAQGGVKADPNDVILVGITAPSDPVGVTITTPCAGPERAVVPHPQSLLHRRDRPEEFFGDPAVRVNAVINTAHNHSLTSICDTDYTGAIQSLGDPSSRQIGVGCLNSPIEARADGTPDCVVTDVTTNPDGSQSVQGGGVVRGEQQHAAVLAGDRQADGVPAGGLHADPGRRRRRRASCRRRASRSPTRSTTSSSWSPSRSATAAPTRPACPTRRRRAPSRRSRAPRSPARCSSLRRSGSLVTPSTQPGCRPSPRRRRPAPSRARTTAARAGAARSTIGSGVRTERPTAASRRRGCGRRAWLCRGCRRPS